MTLRLQKFSYFHGESATVWLATASRNPIKFAERRSSTFSFWWMLNGASRLTYSVSHDRFLYAFWLVEELWSMYQFSSGDWVMVKDFSEGDHLEMLVLCLWHVLRPRATSGGKPINFAGKGIAKLLFRMFLADGFSCVLRWPLIRTLPGLVWLSDKSILWERLTFFIIVNSF